jgi:hypothetical protein
VAAVPVPVAVLQVTANGLPVMVRVFARMVPAPMIVNPSRAANVPALRKLNADTSMEDHPSFIGFLHNNAESDRRSDR